MRGKAAGLESDAKGKRKYFWVLSGLGLKPDGPFKLGVCGIGRVHFGVRQVSAYEYAFTHLGTGEVCRVQLCFGEISMLQIRPPQIYFF